MLDLNHTVFKQREGHEAIQAAIDGAVIRQERREYLGASGLNGRMFGIGSDCLRMVQWNWQEPVPHSPRVQRIFDRGHWIEQYVIDLLLDAGFDLETGDAFSQLDGKFQGHTDGRVVHSPVPIVQVPALLEIKGLGAAGFKKLQKEGLKRAYPSYAEQVALYQAYCGLTDNPALFIAVEVDTMKMEILLVPYDVTIAQHASDKALRIIMAVEHAELLPRVSDNPAYFSCKRCVYRSRCWGDV